MRTGQAAKTIGATPNTVRNYLKRYPELFSTSAISQTDKNFTPRDLSTLREIKRLLDSGLRHADIDADMISIPEVLAPEDMEYDNQPFDTVAPTSAITLPQVTDFVQQALDNAALQHQREIDAKDETIALLRDELERARLPWWKRLF